MQPQVCAPRTGNLGRAPRAEQVSKSQTFTPLVDIYENENELLLIAGLPGVTSEQVQIHFEPERLTLEATRTFPGPDGAEGAEADRKVTYKRVFTVAPIFDAERVTAKLERGVLRLTLPKSAAVRPRVIPVTTA